ncbi:histidinol-phosphate transaminase [Longibacter salinarum]|uniref:Histidinol-phosphate aminotransferase n=2 Tax=Longibacter salinarum TaxID=1850348 RepID=A0A2A8CZN6_9BACT|nr:histidinol-phosphate transaminase [Longibacter salinarum]
MNSTPALSSIDDVISLIRPSVRNEHAYVVGAPSHCEVKLNQNESPFDLPADLKEELAEAFTKIEANRYPDEQPTKLRNALAERDGVDPEGIIVGNGSNELTYTFGTAFIDPGTPVVMPRPMFSLYEKVARICGADLTPVAPSEDLSFDAGAIEKAVVETDAVMTVLTTPNNPTGLAMPMEEIEQIVSAANGVVVVDEAYVEFNPVGSATHLLEKYPNVVILRTLSKGMGLAGVRLGYMIARPELAHEVMKSRLPFMVDRFSEQIALSLLDREDLLAERVGLMKQATQKLIAALEEMPGVDVVPSDANFCIFRTDRDADALQADLADAGVLVRNMSGYPELPGYLRVSAGTEAENKAFLTALERSLRGADTA